jgi:hypothetical protein
MAVRAAGYDIGVGHVPTSRQVSSGGVESARLEWHDAKHIAEIRRRPSGQETRVLPDAEQHVVADSEETGVLEISTRGRNRKRRRCVDRDRARSIPRAIHFGPAPAENRPKQEARLP